MAGQTNQTHMAWQPDHPAQAGFALPPEWMQWLRTIGGANVMQGTPAPTMPSVWPSGAPSGGPSAYPYSNDFAGLGNVLQGRR